MMQRLISDWAETQPYLNLDIETPTSSAGSFESSCGRVNEANGRTLDKQGFDDEGNPAGADIHDSWSEEFWRDDA